VYECREQLKVILCYKDLMCHGTRTKCQNTESLDFLVLSIIAFVKIILFKRFSDIFHKNFSSISREVIG